MSDVLDIIDGRVQRAFQESLDKLQNSAHANDAFENGYAAALQDVRLLIASIRN
jgi:hypothetical protein